MSSTRDDEIDFGILLHLAFAGFKDALHARMAAEGFDDLGPSFGFVFRALGDGPLNLRAVAERLAISPQGALKIIDDMVAKRYVQRRADPTDKRATLLALAPRGAKALATARRFHRRCEAELAERLGARRVAEAREVLEALAATGEAAGQRPF